MSKIKLPHASGNSMSIAAPATNPSGDLELKLPATIGTAGQVLRNSSTPGTLEFGTLSAGKILQVVSNTKTDIYSSTTAQSWTDIGGVDQAGSGSIFAVKITPSATSSKILINTSIHYGMDDGYDMILFRIMRGSTAIAIGDAANNRPRGTSSSDPKSDATTGNACFMHLDSPSSTSELTYNIEFWAYHGNTFYVNRSYRHHDDANYDYVAASNITVMEVGA